MKTLWIPSYFALTQDDHGWLIFGAKDSPYRRRGYSSLLNDRRNFHHHWDDCHVWSEVNQPHFAPAQNSSVAYFVDESTMTGENVLWMKPRLQWQKIQPRSMIRSCINAYRIIILSSFFVFHVSVLVPHCMILLPPGPWIITCTIDKSVVHILRLSLVSGGFRGHLHQSTLRQARLAKFSATTIANCYSPCMPTRMSLLPKRQVFWTWPGLVGKEPRPATFSMVGEDPVRLDASLLLPVGAGCGQKICTNVWLFCRDPCRTPKMLTTIYIYIRPGMGVGKKKYQGSPH